MGCAANTLGGLKEAAAPRPAFRHPRNFPVLCDTQFRLFHRRANQSLWSAMDAERRAELAGVPADAQRALVGHSLVSGSSAVFALGPSAVLAADRFSGATW